MANTFLDGVPWDCVSQIKHWIQKKAKQECRAILVVLYHTSMKYCNLIGPLQVVYFTYTQNVKAPPTFYLYTCEFYDVIKMASTTWSRTACHNAGTVTRCLPKLLYKHHATYALLAIQKSKLDYDRKVAKWRSDHECCDRFVALPQTTHCPKIFAGRQYLRSCLLLYFSRTLLQYFAVAERHTEREV